MPIYLQRITVVSEQDVPVLSVGKLTELAKLSENSSVGLEAEQGQ